MSFRDFEDAKLEPWTASGTSGESKWQVVTTGEATSGVGALYYGNVKYKNFNDGANSGTATSQPIAIPANGKTKLQFNLWMDTEISDTYDLLTVQVAGATVWTKALQKTLKMKTWQTWTVDLSGYAGKTVQLAFAFSAGDATDNSGEGVYVDDVAVIKACP